MSSIRGRFGAALLAFGLITLVTVGGALWLVLRDLHRDAALGSLAELTVPYASQARQRVPAELLRRTVDEHPGVEELRRYRESSMGQRAREAFSGFVEQAQAEISEAGVSVLLISDDTTIVRDPAGGTIQVLETAPQLGLAASSGVSTGRTEIAGLGEVLYAATPIRESMGDRAVPTLLLAREDDSAQLATADLARALLVAALVLTVVGIPLAIGLGRSVGAPLRRLVAASGDVAHGHVPDPLPVSGPREVAEASAAFNAMAAEVDAARQAQLRLLADVRHDLRTPLTVIAGFAEALRDGTARGPAAERAATAISDEAARLERMLVDLDQLTVPGGDGPAMRPQRLDAIAVARSAVERFAGEAEARGQSIGLLPTGAQGTPVLEPCSIVADRDMLDRILANLVANALAHAPSPGGHVAIEVRPVHPGEQAIPALADGRDVPALLVAVRDDGPGIPRAALPHVFDRFYRADPARASRGSGLGLAIVRDLAEALGGRVFAERPPGGGARVGVVLPMAPGAPSGPLAAGPARA